MRVNTRYINSTRGTSSKKDCPQWHKHIPFQAHSATQVCTGIRQNQYLFLSKNVLCNKAEWINIIISMSDESYRGMFLLLFLWCFQAPVNSLCLFQTNEKQTAVDQTGSEYKMTLLTIVTVESDVPHHLRDHRYNRWDLDQQQRERRGESHTK